MSGSPTSLLLTVCHPGAKCPYYFPYLLPIQRNVGLFPFLGFTTLLLHLTPYLLKISLNHVSSSLSKGPLLLVHKPYTFFSLNSEQCISWWWWWQLYRLAFTEIYGPGPTARNTEPFFHLIVSIIQQEMFFKSIYICLSDILFFIKYARKALITNAVMPT